MRDSIAGAWLYGIVVIFMAFFIAFIAITVNYSNAYRLHSEIVTIVEQYNGLDAQAVALINEKILQHGYLQRGTCSSRLGQSVNMDERWVGVLDSKVSRKSGLYQYCVTRTESSDGGRNVDSYYYYNVTLFFGFDLPFFGRLFTFRVNGSTAGISASLRNHNEYFEDSKYDAMQH